MPGEPRPSTLPDGWAEDYRRAAATLAVGKKLPDATYVHREVLPQLPTVLLQAVAEAEALAGITGGYDIVKFSTTAPMLSLLAYPRFFDDPFPSLELGWAVDLEGGQVEARRFGGSNPPILHRKETMLPPGHPRSAEFAALTTAAEQAGLFADTKTIGRKKNWEARLAAAGLHLEGHRLVPVGAEIASPVVEMLTPSQQAQSSPPASAKTPTPEAVSPIHPEPTSVLRHRTAMTRYGLSTPMQALWRHGYLDSRLTVLDYGCGRGDDVRALKERGIEARGWDPHFSPDGDRSPADVVNLGFVLNVIEEPKERVEALRSAYSLARRVLSVAVVSAGRETAERVRPWRDGVLTARGTFQKAYGQDELRSYLSGALGREPVAVGPGAFFIFRDDADEQAFLAARQRSSAPPLPPRRAAPPQSPRTPRQPRPGKPTPWEIHGELLESLWAQCLDLGREPDETEVPSFPEIREGLGSLSRALRLVRQAKPHDELEQARTRRMGDLLVYFALNLFERRRSAATLPDALRRDIRLFWGSQAKAQEEASRLLFSVGKPTTVLEGCRAAAVAGLGHLDNEHSLMLRASTALRLPPALRVYLGCATMLYGDVEGADLVKLHVQSGKVTFLTYEDFDESPLPVLLERVKVDMRRQEVQFFGALEGRRQLLFHKSRYLPPEDPSLATQRTFEAQLDTLGLFDLSGFGPDEATFREGLAAAGMRLSGFALEKATRTRKKKSGPSAS